MVGVLIDVVTFRLIEAKLLELNLKNLNIVLREVSYSDSLRRKIA